MESKDIMHSFQRKCKVRLEGNNISKAPIIHAYSDFIISTIEKRKHNVGIVKHTGSICFDAIIIVYAAVLNLISNETATEDVIESLENGDMVVFGDKKKERFVFEGIVDGSVIDKSYTGNKYIKLVQNDATRYVPEAKWRTIEPYNGKSTRLDGRGIKRKSSCRDSFFTEILGFDERSIPSIIDTSTVIVMSKDEADFLVKNISISFDDKEIQLLDLVTASFFTEEEEHPYGGNTSKNEAVLKFCSRVSSARSLIFSRDGNRHIGLLVLGKDAVRRGEFELPELLARKSLQYVYVSTLIDNSYGEDMLEDDEEMEIFACTKKLIQEKAASNLNHNNKYTIQLQNQTFNITNRENSVVILDDGITEPEYNTFRKKLLAIKRNQYESENKDNFVIQSFSLMNLFLSIPFSIDYLQKAIKEERVSVESVDEKIEKLQKWADELPVSLREDTYYIIDSLESYADRMKRSTGKEVFVRGYIMAHGQRKVAIIVPKAYYISVLRDGHLFSPQLLRNITIATPGRFDGEAMYDEIIVLGNIEGKSFDPFKCISSANIISLLYPAEEKAFSYRKYNLTKRTKALNRHSTIVIHNEDIEEEDLPQIEQGIMEEDEEINEYIASIDSVIDTTRIYGSYGTRRSNITTEIVSVATFTDESKAFFSRHYKAYVLDEENNNVKEVGVSDLREGDSIVFTKNNNDTKDIVDSILKQMILDDKMSPTMMESYKRSHEWQDCLIEYMETNELSTRQVVNKIIQLNVPVQEATIARWLDEDAHTVGPRKLESYVAIGKLTGNEEMENNPELFMNSCREVRGLRRRILGEIGAAIMHSLSGKNITKNEELAVVYEKVESLSSIMQIERITPTEKVLPLSVANRPISV